MDIRTQSALLAAIVAVALAVSMLLRPQRAKSLTLFSIFCLSLAAWYLADFLYALTSHGFWLRAAVANGAAIPAAALAFFLEFLGVSRRSASRARTAAFVGALFGLAVAVTPLAEQAWARVVVATWVMGSLTVSLSLLYRRVRSASSRVDRARLTYLLIGGALSLVASGLDMLPRVGVPFPELGAMLTTLYLFFLGQTLQRYRLLDLHELLGKFAALSVLALILALIYGGLVIWVGDRPGLFLFNTLVASFVILNLFEPLRAKVEEGVVATLFRERFELLRTLAQLLERLHTVIDPHELARVTLETFFESRRVTHASLYLLADARPGFSLLDHRGPMPAPFLDATAARSLLAAAAGGQKAVLLENVERRIAELKRLLAPASAGPQPGGEVDDDVQRLFEEQQRLSEIRAALSTMKAGICVPLQGTDRLIGFLNLWDERVPEAYSSDEIALILDIADRAAQIVESSKLYDRMRERDRLAALGEMAAGLAHEIRNPLGAIKGAAQFLEPQGRGDDAEWLQVIVEEVNRLNGVVTQFLDYARPLKPVVAPVDVDLVVERTLKLVQAELPERVELDVRLGKDVGRALSDAEQLKQVLINLIHNALQAMPEKGKITVSTAREDAGFGVGDARHREVVVLRVKDTGPGIPDDQRENVFVPFFTTKEKGTGLGLAICQRIVRSHGGSIAEQGRPGEGAEFVIRLAAAPPEPAALPPAPVPQAIGPTAPPPARTSRRERRRKRA